MRREERVTVQGPVKEQQPDGMSHRGGGETRPLTKGSPRLGGYLGERGLRRAQWRGKTKGKGGETAGGPGGLQPGHRLFVPVSYSPQDSGMCPKRHTRDFLRRTRDGTQLMTAEFWL